LHIETAGLLNGYQLAPYNIGRMHVHRPKRGQKFLPTSLITHTMNWSPKAEEEMNILLRDKGQNVD
jgi:hypothetical protein